MKWEQRSSAECFLSDRSACYILHKGSSTELIVLSASDKFHDAMPSSIIQDISRMYHICFEMVSYKWQVLNYIELSCNINQYPKLMQAFTEQFYKGFTNHDKFQFNS